MRVKAHPFTSQWAVRPLDLLDRTCLLRLARILRGSPVRVRLWNGASVALSDGTPVATVVIHDRMTLVRLLTNTELAFGEAYMSGRLTVQGDLVRMIEGVNRALAGPPSLATRRGRAASDADARRNVHVHYDLGNDFYRLWLDDAMVYTCAYFDRPDASLEDAQRAKLDYVCRKLQLRPGEHVIEAGCGWGALALHMAREYGVSVRAYNVSAAQLQYARERAACEGLADRVTFSDQDYRSIEGRCDAFVSIGMLEHVGPAQYGALGSVIDRVLDRTHGRGLLHFIGKNVPMPFNPWVTKYIFPGAYAPALGEMLEDVLQPHAFSILDVENLRLHYARTLALWLERFEDHAEAIAGMFDPVFVRMWRLYLACAQAGFLSGDLQLFQVTFARADDNTQPWTRESLYAQQSHGSL
ncbi:MAG: class I SAM-dependent methyltransferase [Acidobacteriota bacterium]